MGGSSLSGVTDKIGLGMIPSFLNHIELKNTLTTLCCGLPGGYKTVLLCLFKLLVLTIPICMCYAKIVSVNRSVCVLNSYIQSEDWQEGHIFHITDLLQIYRGGRGGTFIPLWLQAPHLLNASPSDLLFPSPGNFGLIVTRFKSFSSSTNNSTIMIFADLQGYTFYPTGQMIISRCNN